MDSAFRVVKMPLGCFANVLGAFGLVGVPLTLILSFVAFFGFGFSLGGTELLEFLGIGIAAAGGLTLLAGAGILAGAAFLGLAFTSVAVKPMKPLFRIHSASSRRDWVGKECVIRSGSVTATFGQAEVEDGGAGLLLDVRCSEPNDLRRGDPALIYEYNAAGEVYLVRPMGKETNPQ